MTVNISPTEQDYFDDYIRAGVPVDVARRFAREDVAPRPGEPS